MMRFFPHLLVHKLNTNVERHHHDFDVDFDDILEDNWPIILGIVFGILALGGVLAAIIVPIVCYRKRRASKHQAAVTPSGVVRKSRRVGACAGKVQHPFGILSNGTASNVLNNTPNLPVNNTSVPSNYAASSGTVWNQPLNLTVQAFNAHTGPSTSLFPAETRSLSP